MLSFCIMADTQITSPVYLTLYWMMPRWTRDLCICHYTEWQHVGLVICVSDIIQNEGKLDLWSVYQILYRMKMDSWSVYLTFTEWRHVGLVICVSDIIQNDAILDSWSVYLTLYRMMPCSTRDLCIWHYTEWRHVGLVICVSDIIQKGSMLDLWSVYLPLYKMKTCWTRDLIILYNVRCTDHESNIILYNAWYTDHESNIASSCIMSDTQITSPTLRHHV